MERMKTVYERQIDVLVKDKADLNRTLRFVSAEEQELQKKLSVLQNEHSKELQVKQQEVEEWKKAAKRHESEAREWEERYEDSTTLHHNEADVHKIQIQRNEAELDKVKQHMESKMNLVRGSH